MSLKLRLSAGLLISVLHGATAPPQLYAQGPTCDPRDFGAVGDGVNDDTQPFQTALDSCVGGRTVQVSPGTYAIKPLVFNGNGLTVQLDAGASLVGSHDPEDYSFTGALILADTKTDLAIM